MKNSLWKFIDDKATFVSASADRINTLYFPLCNASPIMSSLTPDLHGDLKTDYHSFLLAPVSRLDLSNSKSSRNFWIHLSPGKTWSATGVSKNTNRQDNFSLEAGLLWHKVKRQNKKIGIESEITSFIPASAEPVEIMHIRITNISPKKIQYTATAAIPIFARSADNLHDHRHVTSLLQRTKKHKFGVVAKPTLSFNETGHKKNLTSYFVFGADGKGSPPEYIYCTQEDFSGDSSDLEAPEAVCANHKPAKDKNTQGKEAIAGLKFKMQTLKTKQSASYLIIMGITKTEADIERAFAKFDTKEKIEKSLEATKTYWQKKSEQVKLDTGDKVFDNWFKWVNIQPVLRRIFGCSFLPDFDYGKGGRGWRDLWQDCLALTLSAPEEAGQLLVNNFAGVRIDGSNATIIGSKPGEFIADRNDIPRVWMDHGAWPLITVYSYIQQTGDLKILLEESGYFKDRQLLRSQEIDRLWQAGSGTALKSKDKTAYKGSVLEHIIIENLVQFFNVGPHNFIRLEGADWNDGLDMAEKFGESVAFSCIYAQNLLIIAELLEKLGQDKVMLLKEVLLLLNSLRETQIDYSDINAKRRILNEYFQNTKQEVSGVKAAIPAKELIRDLKEKALWLSEHIRKNEWLKEGFFNGYYDNNKDRVEGTKDGIIRMALTGQALAVMSEVATKEQSKTLFNSASKYLKDTELGGFHLNTDFKEEQLNLGRAFSFIYGDKENGAIFNHMCVLFAYGLYKRGLAKEGYAVFSSIYNMSVDTEKCKIYPCLPEYFNADGRGMYSYLTGSASWFILTLITQVFGVRGDYGNLVIEPKLVGEQFKNKNTVSAATDFAGRKIEVRFTNPRRKDFGNYALRRVSLNNRDIAENIKQPRFELSRSYFLSLCLPDKINIIEVLLD
jgi:cellobiose phosphorylase